MTPKTDVMRSTREKMYHSARVIGTTERLAVVQRRFTRIRSEMLAVWSPAVVKESSAATLSGLVLICFLFGDIDLLKYAQISSDTDH